MEATLSPATSRASMAAISEELRRDLGIASLHSYCRHSASCTTHHRSCQPSSPAGFRSSREEPACGNRTAGEDSSWRQGSAACPPTASLRPAVRPPLHVSPRGRARSNHRVFQEVRQDTKGSTRSHKGRRLAAPSQSGPGEDGAVSSDTGRAPLPASFAPLKRKSSRRAVRFVARDEATRTGRPAAFPTVRQASGHQCIQRPGRAINQASIQKSRKAPTLVGRRPKRGCSPERRQRGTRHA
jgi:hypothetical protein